MADVVNLNQFRKVKTRADKAKKAGDNRVKFGRTKAEKRKDEAEQKKLKQELDGKIIPENSDD
jgi:hypothetical protein